MRMYLVPIHHPFGGFKNPQSQKFVSLLHGKDNSFDQLLDLLLQATDISMSPLGVRRPTWLRHASQARWGGYQE
jgi:hypothetical protein